MLVKPMSAGTYYPYRLAVLRHYGYSANKPWCIDYAAYDVETGALRRKRLFAFNNVVDVGKRRAYAERLVAEINEQLKAGYHFDEGKRRDQEYAGSLRVSSGFVDVEAALRMALEVKRGVLYGRSWRDYCCDVNRFCLYMDGLGLLHESVRALDEARALAYADYMSGVEGLANKTINCRVGVLKTLTGELVRRGVVSANVWCAVPHRKEVKRARHVAYSVDELGRIRRALCGGDRRLWWMCQFIFYSLMRPEEVRSLRWRDVDLAAGQVYVCAMESKVKVERYVEVTSGLRAVLEEMGAGAHDAEDYLFPALGGDARRRCGRNTYAGLWRAAREGLGLSECHTLYAFKHTGNVMAYRAGVGIEALMRQNGHSDISTTMVYLRSLGLLRNDDYRSKMDGVII
jgi:integrase